MRSSILLLAVTVMFHATALQSADLLNRIGLTKSTESLAALSQDQVMSGLKEAVAKGVQLAVANLGKPDGFLKDMKVRIPLPDSPRKVERGLRAARQAELADEFVTTMNRAGEQAVPEAAGVLGDSVRQMTAADAKAIAVGTNTAATDYFRRTAGTNLYARFLPIVKKATEAAGVTVAYKRMTDKAGLGGLSGLSGLGGTSFNKDSLDIDAYVTRKAMDGLFMKIAEQEKMIRENPAARTTDLLQKVFGSVGK